MCVCVFNRKGKGGKFSAACAAGIPVDHPLQKPLRGLYVAQHVLACARGGSEVPRYRSKFPALNTTRLRGWLGATKTSRNLSLTNLNQTQSRSSGYLGPSGYVQVHVAVSLRHFCPIHGKKRKLEYAEIHTKLEQLCENSLVLGNCSVKRIQQETHRGGTLASGINVQRRAVEHGQTLHLLSPLDQKCSVKSQET